MIKSRKYVLIVSIAALILFSGFTLWSVTRVSVPDDVKQKLNQELIDRIQAGTWANIHDCVIMCSSTEDTFTVVDTLPSESVKDVWDSLGGFHAFLTPEQIFTIARMDEVVIIDYNAYEIVI